MLRAALRLLLLTLLGCSYANKPSHWPSRGPFVCVQNPTREPLRLIARDGDGRALVLARIAPDGTFVARWPFVGPAGQLLAGPYATMGFAPWSAEGWSWAIGDSLHAGGCP